MKVVVNKETKNSTQHFSRHTNSITVLPATVRMSRGKFSISSCTRLNTPEKIQVSKYTYALLFTKSGAVVLMTFYSCKWKRQPFLGNLSLVKLHKI